MIHHNDPIPYAGAPPEWAAALAREQQTITLACRLLDVAVLEQDAAGDINALLDLAATGADVAVAARECLWQLRAARAAAAAVRRMPPQRVRAALSTRPGMFVRDDGMVVRMGPHTAPPSLWSALPTRSAGVR